MSERDQRAAPTDAPRAVDDTHLVEALAHGRRDLICAPDRQRAECDPALAASITEATEGSRELSVALRRAVPVGEVDDLVLAALARAETPTPSRRSLRIGAALGIAALAGSATVSLALDGGATLEGSTRVLRAGLTVGGALEHAVLALPGRENTASVILVAALFVIVLALRLIDRGRLFRIGGALAPFVLAATLGAGTAHAYDLEGGCGGTPVRVSIDRAPRSVALRQALASGGLGLAYVLPDDPLVSLHVGRAPLTQVLDALLGDGPVRVRCTGSLVAIEPAGTGGWRGGAAAVPPPSPPAAPSAWLAMPASAGSTASPLRDVMTFGGDAMVAAFDEVRDVVTMGGDARIDGRAYGNVVTMGGDADISGLVVGDVLTMGGDIRVAPEGTVRGRLNAMGGEVRDGRTSRGSTAPPNLAIPFVGSPAPAMPAALADCDTSGIADLLGSGARHALLFLFGLIFMALAPTRLRAITHALVDRPARSTVAGVLGLIAVPLLVIALSITIIGIPAAAVVAALGVVSIGAGLVASAMVIGAAIPSRRLSGRPVAQLAVGMLLLFLVAQLPWIGGLAWFIALLAGLGAIALTRAGGRPAAAA